MTVEVERKFVYNAEMMGKLPHIGGVFNFFYYSRMIYIYVCVYMYMCVYIFILGLCKN